MWGAREDPSGEDPPLPSDPGGGGHSILLDIRATTPSLQQRVCLVVVDALVAADIREDIVLVADYELTGLTYELDLRHETRGLFEYSAERRSDGAWACLLRRGWR